MPVVNTSLFGSLYLLPFPAQVPVQERMTWKTSVLEAYDGTEQRFSVRPVARHRFSYSLPASAEVAASGFHTVFGNRGFQWAVPLWAEAQILGAVAPGLTSLPAVTDLYDFRADSLALLWESNQSWQIIEIQSVGVGTLSLYGVTQAFSRAV